MDPTPPNKEERPKNSPRDILTSSNEFFKAGRLHHAERGLTHLLSLSHITRAEIIQGLFLRGSVCISARKLQDARNNFMAILQLEPLHEAATLGLAEVENTLTSMKVETPAFVSTTRPSTNAMQPPSTSKTGPPARSISPTIANQSTVSGCLDFSSTSKPDLPKPVPSALASARIIDKLEMVTYPPGVSAPKEELNVGASNGKFRYDRNFLLQFMSICKDKPDLLPPLAPLGIELSDQSSPAFPVGRGGSGRRQVSGSMASSGSPTSVSRATGIELGVMGSAFGSKTGSGSIFFGMGNFQLPNSLGSSVDRFAESNASRSASSSSGVALPLPRVRSQRGNKQNDYNKLGGAKLEPVTPLRQTSNRWCRSNGDEDHTKAVERNVKSLLNKLTVEKFDSISDQIITWTNTSDGNKLILVSKLVFENAVDEVAWSEVYARLCKKMVERISPEVQDHSIKNAKGNTITGGQLFRKHLLHFCQEDFERRWPAQESAAAAAGKAAGDKEATEKTGVGEKDPYSDKYYIAQKPKRHGLALVKFIGELFKLQMLTERIVREWIKKLLSNARNPKEEDIESICTLLWTVGEAIDTSMARNYMDAYLNRMRELSLSNSITPRMQFMLQDVIELRARKWVAKNASAVPADRPLQPFGSRNFLVT